MNKFDIGKRIESYREKLKMSTQELAHRINRSQATISRIENGKQGLTFELLSRIATVLRIHPFALLSDEPLRSSVLLPPADRNTGEYAPSLLANALHGGRIRRELKLDEAAEALNIVPTELEAIELALSSPESQLLGAMCELYGLSREELDVLQRFGNDAPGVARSLAYLQQLFSHIHHMLKQVQPDEEKKALDKIRDLLESADSEYPLPPDASSDDIGLFLNRLSMHLVNALKNKEFRGKMLQMVGDENPVPARYADADDEA